MKLRNFNLGDALYVCSDLRPDDTEQIAKFGMDVSLDALAVTCYQLIGPKWTFEDDEGKALVIGGLIPQRAGVANSWFLASNHAWTTAPRQITAMAVDRVNWAHENGIHRVETLCLASRTKARYWYEKVGLRFEATLKGFCVNGENAVSYVSVTEKGGP